MPPLPADDLALIATHTAPLWNEMRGQRLFLTGGTGFFGVWLTESFLHINRTFALDAHLTVLTRDPAAFTRKCPHLASYHALTLLPGDVRTFNHPQGDFAYIIHAATEASARQVAEAPLEMLSTILDGTARILDFAATHNTRKLLLTSSGAVYGKQPATLSHIPEDFLGGPDPLDPASVYAEGKRLSEQMCALHARQSSLQIKIARCFAFIGPHLPLDTHFAIGNLLRDALNNSPIQIAGDGTPLRSYLYAADLAIWLWTILFQAPSMQAINVGSEEAISIATLAQTIAATLNPTLPIHIAKTPTAETPPSQYVPSTQRAQQTLSLKPLTTLEESIRRTAAWHTLRTSA
ncbi:NAD-dependent epimerase/dehydratase family protein [Granulicella sp. dw_53]|uniref:NAD-dependent epimerase/dehydratase family protein n=1 Tax=Granulicella sp. dw_53 TaxID=2719792 RepID=UPI001BD47898|nr:NAD-dependent epimerase/dehydratase family protein [Granulicella sp. dw_53]